MHEITNPDTRFAILISGSTLPASIELAYLNGLKRTKCENVQIVETDRIYTNLTFLYKIARRILPNNHRRILAHNKILVREIDKRGRGDVLLIFKGMEVLPDTLKKAKKAGLILVNYNPDHPFIFSGRGSGNANVRNGIKWFDLYMTYALDAKQALEKRNIPSYVLPFGFENSSWMGQSLLKEEEINSCCFIGNPDSIRVAFLQEFAKNIPLHLYGTGWSQSDFTSSVKIHEAVTGKEFYQTLRKYRVQLNLMRPHNLNSHNMRTFDVPGCGGIGLMPRTRDHEHFFSDSNEAFIYDEVTDAAKTARHILDLSYEEAVKIRKSAREKTLQLGGDYNSRAQLMFDNIVSIQSKQSDSVRF
jgi:hypothetical protein